MYQQFVLCEELSYTFGAYLCSRPAGIGASFLRAGMVSFWLAGQGSSALKHFAVRYGLRLANLRNSLIPSFWLKTIKAGLRSVSQFAHRKSLRTFAKMFLMCRRHQPASQKDERGRKQSKFSSLGKICVPKTCYLVLETY